ncbi:uncharacterized protein PpBr36_10667 [Pyricularia pennisetigena]|uniref:uncharacterized protein n=1 Tax=Pyricularia pennisetigena TaxID=1578925 RepID=UPI00114FE31A|nr:uncharacterized protein PpBr36_10667 [Pyricularia pennisetigena]TLS20841.1 hypothetical protein PpBr36_10667 [Pyricularia pennisetigena]
MKLQFRKDHQYFASPRQVTVAHQSLAGPIHSHWCCLAQGEEQVQVPDQAVEAVEARASVPGAEVVEFVVQDRSSWLRSTGARLRIGRLSVPFP